MPKTKVRLIINLFEKSTFVLGRNDVHTMSEDQRDFKTRPEHWEIIINYLEEYPNLLRGKFDQFDSDAVNMKNIWEKMSQHLNSLGYGQKSSEKWQLAIGRWKSKVKHKAANLRIEMERTGGGPPKKPPLTDIEERLMKILGWKSVTGDKNKEFGIDKYRCVTQEPGPSTPGGSSSTETIPISMPLKVLSQKSKPEGSSCTETLTETVPVPDMVPSLHFFKTDVDNDKENKVNKHQIKTSACPTKRKIPLRTERSKKMVTLSTMHSEQLTVLKNIEKGVSSFTQSFSDFRDDFREYLQITKRRHEGEENSM